MAYICFQIVRSTKKSVFKLLVPYGNYSFQFPEACFAIRRNKKASCLMAI